MGKYAFAAYIFFMVFGLMNVLTAAFTNKALQLSNLDRDILVKQEKNDIESFVLDIKNLFEEMGPDEDGILSWEKFCDHLKDENVSAYFSTRGLNVLDAREMFRWMDEFDNDPNEQVQFDEFLMGMMRLTGQARSSDLMV